MKRYFLIGLLLLTACNAKTTIPEDVLPENKMILILSEIHMAETEIQNINFKSVDSSYALQRAWEIKIMKKFKTDTATYNRSYKFYLTHVEYMQDIYTAVADTLQKRNEQMEKKNSPSPKTLPKVPENNKAKPISFIK